MPTRPPRSIPFDLRPTPPHTVPPHHILPQPMLPQPHPSHPVPPRPHSRWQPYEDPICNRVQLMALLYLTAIHLSTVLFLDSAYFAQTSSVSLGFTMVTLLFGLLGAVVFLLFR